MVNSIEIKNFKSVADEKIELGRVNVLIGSNGSGKSNILEAIAFLSTSLIDKSINNDILSNKGVRLAKPSLTITSERGKEQKTEIKINSSTDDNFINTINAEIKKDTEWKTSVVNGDLSDRKKQEKFADELSKLSQERNYEKFSEVFDLYFEFINKISIDNKKLSNFLIYSLNTLTLRGLATVSHQSPVGIYGENLDVLIANFDAEERRQLKEYFYLIDWLEDYILDTEDALKLRGFKRNLGTSRLYFEDKYMRKKDNNHIFSSENANEGILHLFFYLAIMISKKTPAFFAIDNIESCLNPHLCRHLMKEICKLAEANNKQVIITTHNPAILDGLNLHDDNVRLFEVKRNEKGLTKTRRIKVKPKANGKQYKLSELWTNGFLGAIPENF